MNSLAVADVKVLGKTPSHRLIAPMRETALDTDPSEIRRRFSQRHTFQHSGQYEVRLNLKSRGDVVISGRTTIQVRGDNRGFR